MLKDFLLANLTTKRVIVAVFVLYGLALILFPTPLVLLVVIVIVMIAAFFSQFSETNKKPDI